MQLMVVYWCAGRLSNIGVNHLNRSHHEISHSKDSYHLSNMESNMSSINSEELLECTDMTARCRTYLNGYLCQNGDYCSKSHSYPRDDKVLCRDFKYGMCNRTASKCWYFHPGQVVNNLPDNERLPIVQAMGSLIAELRSKMNTRSTYQSTSDTINPLTLWTSVLPVINLVISM